MCVIILTQDKTGITRSKRFERKSYTMARFTLPRDIYHGKDALDALNTFEGKKAIVST